MQIKKKIIERGLLGKGFAQDNTDHEILRLVVDGKTTKVRTKLSFGSKYKDCGDTLLDCVKKQLHFGTKTQLVRLIDCTTRHEEYVAYLRTLGVCL